MDALSAVNPLDVVFRWMHIGSVIVLLGGSVFVRFVLMPACDPLPESDHAALRQRVMGRWRIFVHALIGFLLISGIYTVAMKISVKPPVWHMMFGIKGLLAIAVFFIASALVGRSKTFQPMRDNAKLWIGVNVALAALIVMISGVMRSVQDKEKRKEPAKVAIVERPVDAVR